MHIMWKDVFKFEILTLDEPKKKQNGSQQIQNGCHRVKIEQILLKHLKLQVEGCSFYWLDVFLMFVIIDIDT